MKKHLLAASLLLLVTITVRAQDDKIEADRPGEAQSPKVVGKDTLQAELGIEKEQQSGSDFSWEHPEAEFRYGVLKNVELRLHTTWETQRFRAQNEFNQGLKPVEAGVKATLFQTKDTGFTVGLYSLIGLPQLASKDHRHKTVFYNARLLFENKLTERISLGYNVGRGWNDEQKQQNWMYALAPQFQLSDKWEVFVEEFGFLKKNSKPEHYIDGGFAYTISNHVKIDIYAGKGLGGEAADYFLTAGVSFKL